MSTWGYDIFDNDEATDIRALFEDELNVRASVAHATVEILRESKEALNDPESASIIWLALAALQLGRGELHADVRDHALAVIDSGEDLKRWEAEASPDDAAGRKRVLEELREQIAAHR
ncbi:MAG: DUF4259 domain-containing protein [Thermomicrobia bacterium]|nr:DUF4259 domain-containing protein [Thermomicrobia bacterium]